MAQHIVTDPAGVRHVIEAPDDATPEQVVAYAQQVIPRVSQLESLGRGAVQGVTFGFGDELYGAGAGAYDKLFGSGDFSGTYERERNAVRNANDQAKQANPGTYLLGEIGGGVALPLGGLSTAIRGGKLAADASMGAKSFAAAKEGAAYGGAYGLGIGEGDAGEQITSTLGGAVGGGVLGSAIPGAVKLAGAALRVPGQAMRVLTDPQRVAAEKYAEATARDAGSELVPTTGETPIARVVDRLNAPDAWQQGVRGELHPRLQRNDKILGDFAGENTQQLIKAASNMPNARGNRFNQVLNRRAAVEPRKLAEVLESSLGNDREYFGAIDELVTARDKAATPEFSKAYAARWQVKPEGDLVRFLQRGYMQRLVEKTKQTVQGMTGKRADEVDSIFDAVTPATPKDTAAASELRQNIGQLDPAEAQAIFDQFKYVQSLERQPRPQSLSDFLLRNGGIQNEQGEVRHLLGRVKDRPGLVSKQGMSLDDAARIAWDKGFIRTPERPTVREFLEALGDDLAGNRVVRQADDKMLEDLAVAEQMRVDLERMGITSSLSDRALKEGLGLTQGVKRADVLATDARNSWELLHRVKMEINREIGRLKRGQQDSVQNWTLADLTALNKQYGELLAAENPALGKALKNYSDSSGLMNAAEDGLDDFFKLAPEELAKKVRGLSKDEAELYRLGATRAQIAKLREGDVMRDKTKSLYNSDDVGRRLKAIFPEGPQRGVFIRAINAARREANLRRVVQGNSSTVKQLTHAKEAGKAIETASTAAHAAHGSLHSIGKLLERGHNFASGITPQVAAEILNLAMTKGGREVSARSNRAIREASARGQRRLRRQGLIGDALLPAPGLLSANFSTPQQARQR